MIDRANELARDLAESLLGKDNVGEGDITLIKEYLNTYANEEIHNFARTRSYDSSFKR